MFLPLIQRVPPGMRPSRKMSRSTSALWLEVMQARLLSETGGRGWLSGLVFYYILRLLSEMARVFLLSSVAAADHQTLD